MLSLEILGPHWNVLIIKISEMEMEKSIPGFERRIKWFIFILFRNVYWDKSSFSMYTVLHRILVNIDPGALLKVFPITKKPNTTVRIDIF